MYRSLFVIMCIVLGIGESLAQTADKNPVATMHKPVGTVECRTEGKWKKAIPAMPLYSEDIERTGARSFAIIK